MHIFTNFVIATGNLKIPSNRYGLVINTEFDLNPEVQSIVDEYYQDHLNRISVLRQLSENTYVEESSRLVVNIRNAVKNTIRSWSNPDNRNNRNLKIETGSDSSSEKSNYTAYISIPDSKIGNTPKNISELESFLTSYTEALLNIAKANSLDLKDLSESLYKYCISRLQNELSSLPAPVWQQIKKKESDVIKSSSIPNFRNKKNLENNVRRLQTRNTESDNSSTSVNLLLNENNYETQKKNIFLNKTNTIRSFLDAIFKLNDKLSNYLTDVPTDGKADYLNRKENIKKACNDRSNCVFLEFSNSEKFLFAKKKLNNLKTEKQLTTEEIKEYKDQIKVSPYSFINSSNTGGKKSTISFQTFKDSSRENKNKSSYNFKNLPRRLEIDFSNNISEQSLNDSKKKFKSTLGQELPPYFQTRVQAYEKTEKNLLLEKILSIADNHDKFVEHLIENQEKLLQIAFQCYLTTIRSELGPILAPCIN